MTDSGPPAPTVISHYRLLRRLGGGAMGNVYEAEDRRDNSRVALKLMWPHLNEDESFRLRFEREAHAAALLRSPYAVKLLDYGTAGGQAYLVMEYVDGESLGARLKRGPLSVLEAVRIAGDIGRALEEAQARDIVHRDLKPDNILIDREGRAHVTDFGVAHMAGGSGTVTGGFVGTARYCAPQQLSGAVDHRSDQYALGIMLFEMLTGRPPFEGSAPELWRQHADAPLPLEALAGQPQALIDIVERCTEKQPNSRFTVPAELLVALSKVEASLRSPISAFSPAPTTAARPTPAVFPEPLEAPSIIPPAAPESPPPPLAEARVEPAIPPPSGPPPPFSVPAVPAGQPYQQNGVWVAMTDAGLLTWDERERRWAAPAPGVAPATLAPGPRGPGSSYGSPWPAAWSVIVAMAAVAIVAFVAAALAGRQAALSDGGTFEEFVSRDDAKDVALGLQIFAILVVLPLLGWLGVRVTKNARAINAGAALLPGHVAVWSWWLPLANLIVPFVALHRVWTASGRSNGSGSGSSTGIPTTGVPVPWLIWAWCVASVVGAGLWAATLGLDDDPEDLLNSAAPTAPSLTLRAPPPPWPQAGRGQGEASAFITPDELAGNSEAIMYLQIVLGLLPPVGMAAVWALAKRQSTASKQAGP